MLLKKFRYLFLLILCSCFIPQLQAKEINLFDGLIKIRTYDNNDRPQRQRHDHDRDGHYEIINGRLVWVVERDRHNSHISDDQHEMWVLLTRIRNTNFDWIIIPAHDRHKIRRYLNRGYQRSMTGRKKSCYKMGKKKERLWRKHAQSWQ